MSNIRSGSLGRYCIDICCLCSYWLSNSTSLLWQCFCGLLIVGLFSLSEINTSTVAISAQVKQTHTHATMLWCVVDKNLLLLLLLQSRNGVLCGFTRPCFCCYKVKTVCWCEFDRTLLLQSGQCVL